MKEIEKKIKLKDIGLLQKLCLKIWKKEESEIDEISCSVLHVCMVLKKILVFHRNRMLKSGKKRKVKLMKFLVRFYMVVWYFQQSVGSSSGKSIRFNLFSRANAANLVNRNPARKV